MALRVPESDLALVRIRRASLLNDPPATTQTSSSAKLHFVRSCDCLDRSLHMHTLTQDSFTSPARMENH